MTVRGHWTDRDKKEKKKSRTLPWRTLITWWVGHKTHSEEEGRKEISISSCKIQEGEKGEKKGSALNVWGVIKGTIGSGRGGKASQVNSLSRPL